MIQSAKKLYIYQKPKCERRCREITRIQQDGVLVKFWKFRRPDGDERDSVFPVAVEGRVGEGFSLVFAEKAGVTENYVINLVAGTFTVQSVPFFLRLLTFSAKRKVPVQDLLVSMRQHGVMYATRFPG